MPTLAYILILAMIALACGVWWVTPRVSHRTRHLVKIIGLIGMIFLVLAFAAIFIVTPL